MSPLGAIRSPTYAYKLSPMQDMEAAITTTEIKETEYPAITPPRSTLRSLARMRKETFAVSVQTTSNSKMKYTKKCTEEWRVFIARNKDKE